MRNKKLLLSTFALITLFQAHYTFAEPGEIADKVVSQYSKLRAPDKSTHKFDEWVYNIAAFSAIHCWKLLKKEAPLPSSLKYAVSTNTGTWSLPENDKAIRLCSSLAKKGIKPVCTHSNVWAKNVKRRSDLPMDYLQVYKNKPLEIEGTLGCYLNEDQIDKQTYVGPLAATWSEKPVLKSIQLRSGLKNLETGTVLLTSPHVPGLDGKEYREPRLTVVISE